MKEKIKYAYQVGHVALATREAARIVQRSIRSQAVVDPTVTVPRIVQKITVERIVR